MADRTSPSSPLAGSENLRRIPLARLMRQRRTQFPIHSSDGILLLAEGSEVTERTVEALANRGIETIWVHRGEPAARRVIEAVGSATDVPPHAPGEKLSLQTTSTRRLDYHALDRIAAALGREEPPFLQDLKPVGAVPYEEALSHELRQDHEEFVDSLQGVMHGILARRERVDSSAEKIVTDYLRLLLRDLDLFTHFAAAPEGTHYPHRHSLHVAMLSLALGARAGLGEADLRTLAMGALLADIGMLRIPRSILKQRGPLSIAQRFDVMQHPIHSVDMLDGVGWVPEDARYVVYQSHERSNGAGYPRRTVREGIHPLARIVGVADTYVAMVSDRPHRPAILPYKAQEAIVRQAATGLFDSATVRLLIETLSLYPVGSYVLLDDGRLAKVLRGNGPRYDRPVVRAWDLGEPPEDTNGELLDLVAEESLNVIRAVPAPADAFD